MFKYWIVKTKRLNELENIEQRMFIARRWLSGFKDLDILWDYLFGEKLEGMDTVRTRYAQARGTNVYGKPLDKVRLEAAEEIVDLVKEDPLLSKHLAQRLAKHYREHYE